jgi:hypothetical protein
MRRKSMTWLLLLLALLLIPHLVTVGLVYGESVSHWSRARWDSSGLAPNPATTPEAVVQVYGARAWGWKGIFAVHTWIVVKPERAPAYQRYEVVGWGVDRGQPAVRRNMRPTDGHWAGNPPQILVEHRGPEAQAMIPKIERAILTYPYPDEYRTWPGPNSNTFVAAIARAVPELGLEMPPTAIGKDYLDNGLPFARTPSGTGIQLSLGGLLGLSIGRDEGFELNILGLTIGVDPLGFALKLPGIGRLGFS